MIFSILNIARIRYGQISLNTMIRNTQGRPDPDLRTAIRPVRPGRGPDV